jgi:hypothetical protein
MKHLFCLVGLALVLGVVMPLHGEGLPNTIDVVVVSASSSSLEEEGSSSSVSQEMSSSESTGPNSSDSKPSSSSRRSDDDSPLIPVISHDSKASADEKTSAISRGISVPAAQVQDCWFDLQGRLLKGKPTVQGTYYHNGRAVVIK